MIHGMDTLTPPANPRRYARTAQKLASRRRQGERWERASLAVADELERLWLNPDAAWRRWMDADRVAP